MKLKLLCISDTHTKERGLYKWLLPDADVIVHGGDIMNSGYKIDDLIEFLDWYSSLGQYKYKIFIAGNHDRWIQNNPEDFKDMLLSYPNVIYLEDNEVVIEGIKFYGSPWQPWFYNWAFNASRTIEEANAKFPWIKNYWDKIPDDTDVLITHGPPYGILDKTKRGEHTGCRELLKKVTKVSPYVNIFGHIHEGYGHKRIGITNFINASVLDENYDLVNDPVLLEIDTNDRPIRNALKESTCQKRQVICQIFDIEGNLLATESNRCNPEGGMCHRLGLIQSKSDYDVDSHCNWKHAEIRAIEALPADAKPHSAILFGHSFLCDNCESELKRIGVNEIKIIEEINL